MSVTAAIHQPECFPWLGFIDKALRADVFILLDDVQYEKNYFQNRNKVKTSAGPTWLTVPVATKGRFGQAIREVAISPAAVPRWKERHLATWTQSYAAAPCADRPLAFLRSLYAKDWELLVDFNLAVIAELFSAFAVKAKVVRSSELKSHGSSSAKLRDLCKAVGADVYLSGVSGHDYLDGSLFEKEKIRVDFQEFRHPVYPQLHGEFAPAMSAMDLLFNAGPQAASFLTDEKSPRLDTVFL